MIRRPWFALLNRIQEYRLKRVPPGTEVTVRSVLARHPLICRAHTSDYRVFGQVFREGEYTATPRGQRPDVILDCGANVGYTSAYFLTRYPSCRVLAIEPDADNFRCLATNLAPYGTRAACIQGGVWSSCAQLKMADTPYRDGQCWSKQVTEGGTIPGFDVPALMQRAGVDRIAILKMDIEGAEAVVFAQPDLDWLDRVETIMIELHDDSTFGDGPAIFHHAIADRGFQTWTHGEITVCSRFARH